MAFAIGAVVTTQGTDKIRLVPLATDTEDEEFTGSNTFLGAKLEATPRVAKCQLTVHKYTASNTVETLLEDEEISGEDVLVTFDEPHHSYEITGGAITGSGANWIAVTADGAVTVTAKAYNHTTTVRSKKNSDATYTERSNVVSVTDATLVSKSNRTAVLNRLYAAALWRQTLTQEVIITDQRAGMIVQSDNPWGGKTQGMIVSVDSELTQNGHTAQITIIGGEVSE